MEGIWVIGMTVIRRALSSVIFLYLQDSGRAKRWDLSVFLENLISEIELNLMVSSILSW